MMKTQANQKPNEMANEVIGVDYLILGAGPAGLQLGYSLAQKGLDYRIIEGTDTAGAFFKQFPRHRQMISINKTTTGIKSPDTNLRWDWNSLLTDDHSSHFSEYSREYFPKADDFVTYLGDFAKKYQLKIDFNTKVVQVAKNQDFLVSCESGKQYRAKRVIVATGLAKSRVPDTVGIEHCEMYDNYPIDPAGFQDQKVMVIGKGNSALEVADSLINTTAVIHLISPKPVKLAWNTHYVGDVRAVNNNFLDTYQLKSQNTILDADIEKIEKLPDGRLQVLFKYTHAEEQVTRLTVDRIIVCAGFMLDTSIFDGQTCMPQLMYNDKLPQLTNEWESTNIEGLYFAGTLMHSRDFKKSFSGFVHGFRYNIRCLARLLEHKHEAKPLHFDAFELNQASLVSTIIDRVCISSSMFQQPAFIADLMVFDPDNASVQHFQELSVDYIRDNAAFADKSYFMITMEYGKLGENEDPFDINRHPSEGSKSVFIHPVIRFFSAGEYVDEYHIPEDLENEWDVPFYTDPLREFVVKVLSR